MLVVYIALVVSVLAAPAHYKCVWGGVALAPCEGVCACAFVVFKAICHHLVRFRSAHCIVALVFKGFEELLVIFGILEIHYSRYAHKLFLARGAAFGICCFYIGALFHIFDVFVDFGLCRSRNRYAKQCYCRYNCSSHICMNYDCLC